MCFLEMFHTQKVMLSNKTKLQKMFIEEFFRLLFFLDNYCMQSTQYIRKHRIIFMIKRKIELFIIQNRSTSTIS